MMNTVKQKIKGWKMALIIPIGLLTIFVMSCNDEVMQDVNTVMETASQSEMPENVKAKLEKLQKKYPDADFAYIEADGSSEESLTKLNEFDPKSVGTVMVYKERERVGALINRNGPLKQFNGTAADEVFTIVEEMPEYIGGEAKLYEEMNTKIKYPEAAKKAGIEGKVYVQFIIDKEGNVTNAKVVKGIGGECDEAALEFVNQMEKWTPAKQRGQAVKMRMIMPFTFKLDDKNSNTAAPSGG